MKLTKLFVLLTSFILLFIAPNYAQTPKPAKEATPTPKTFSDISVADLSDVQMLISGTFAERRITGKVVGIHDGDTATVLDKDKQQYKLCFNGIDAPELKMDFGRKSKENLSDWIFGKEVTVLYSKIDKYGRFVGTIFVNGVDVNLEQIKAGLAWHYKKYADEQSEKDRIAYATAETAAREAKKGLWVQPNSTPPWEYRASLKVKQEENRESRKYLVGSRGGCYYLNSSGNKTYVDKKFCANKPPVVTELKLEVPKKTETIRVEDKKTNATVKGTVKKSDSSGRTYIRGSRGGCYYLNSSGNKSYVDKELCNRFIP